MALRARHRDEVAAETRRRVLQAAQELSFQPNVLARGLISGRTRTVGLLTDDLAGRFAIPVLQRVLVESDALPLAPS